MPAWLDMAGFPLARSVPELCKARWRPLVLQSMAAVLFCGTIVPVCYRHKQHHANLMFRKAADELDEQKRGAEEELQQQKQVVYDLRKEKERAEHEFSRVIEQTQVDLDEDDGTIKLQVDKLQREHVEGLNSQLHVYMRCATAPRIRKFATPWPSCTLAFCQAGSLLPWRTRWTSALVDVTCQSGRLGHRLGARPLCC
jgi:hypothetical protein